MVQQMDSALSLCAGCWCSVQTVGLYRVIIICFARPHGVCDRFFFVLGSFVYRSKHQDCRC